MNTIRRLAKRYSLNSPQWAVFFCGVKQESRSWEAVERKGPHLSSTYSMVARLPRSVTADGDAADPDKAQQI